jgi:hypothetical protein
MVGLEDEGSVEFIVELMSKFGSNVELVVVPEHSMFAVSASAMQQRKKKKKKKHINK